MKKVYARSLVEVGGNYSRPLSKYEKDRINAWELGKENMRFMAATGRKPGAQPGNDNAAKSHRKINKIQGVQSRIGNRLVTIDKGIDERDKYHGTRYGSLTGNGKNVTNASWNRLMRIASANKLSYTGKIVKTPTGETFFTIENNKK
jgi:hypothetical protein